MRKLMPGAGLCTLAGFLLAAGTASGQLAPGPDEQFAALAEGFVKDYPMLSPVNATTLGEHRYDDLLDEVSRATRIRTASFLRKYLVELDGIDRDELSRDNQIDAALLKKRIEYRLWLQEKFQNWAWDPTLYTGLAGSSIYGLMARDFAPVEQRLSSVTARLEQLPRFLTQVRVTLKPERVPPVHAETAVRQNPGLKSILDNLVLPEADKLDAKARARLQNAIDGAREALDEHQEWLENDLLPKAQGDFRIGSKLFDQRLAFTLHTPLSRKDIRNRARREYDRVRSEMYALALPLYKAEYPYMQFPDKPGTAMQQVIIRHALEKAYAARPARGQIVSVAREYLEQAERFVRDRDLVTVPDEEVKIIVMPEFQRGVAVAYCDPPGPLAVGQDTFYAVAPLPDDWTETQVQSFLREYNLLSIQDLTIHEAMPGHFLQIAHSNRHPSTLRRMLYSGTFVEGWAVYAERMMIDEGYLDGNPLMRLINLKWYLRTITNALLDQAVHVDGITRDEAMQLMVEGGFQEEREAAAKWVRAQLTSTQLSTYFVGFQEHDDLRREVEQLWGESFSLKRYHDTVLSYGSPPAQFVRAMMLDTPVPER
ncbi:MAG: DUF885 domain-containing protein [Pseudomonadota bacterium]